MSVLISSLALLLCLPQAQNARPDPVEARAEALRARLPRKFTVVVERPFVVIGDEAPDRVRTRAARTVRWAVDRLRRDYFPDDPAEVIEIYLFRSADSYRANALRFFGDRPTTPYGYYSPAHRAMVMNISTGGGTLVHELVHPLMEANFPDCPAWLNEGMGSLFEHSSEREGRIVGLTNWRLPALQESIRRGDLPRLDQLLATSDHAFYEDDPGTNYAQARYLLMYLQERGVLRKFYWTFRNGHDADPSGLHALTSVLGVRSLDGFEKEWKRWVLGLRFRSGA
jgi:hypothetical protein